MTIVKDKYGFITATGNTHYGTLTETYNVNNSPLKHISTQLSLHFHIKMDKKFIKEMVINKIYNF